MTSIAPAEQKCKKCGATKPIVEFNRNAQRKLGYETQCRECRNERRKVYIQIPEAKEKKESGLSVIDKQEEKKRDMTLG